MKNIIFDIGGVLVYPRLGEWHIPRRIAEILGPVRAADLDTPRFREAHAWAMLWLDEGRVVADVGTERMLRRGFTLELDRAMGWRMTDAELDAMTDDFTDNIDRYGFFDDLTPFLEKWSRSHTLALLSDAMPSILPFLEQYGIGRYFSQAVVSTQVGALKPSPRMYAEICRRLGAAPADCLFVDDRVCNVRGALEAGMAAVQMSRPEFPAEEIWDGPVAHSFAELDAMIDRQDVGLWQDIPLA